MTMRIAGGDPLNAQKFRTQRADQPEDIAQPLYDRVNYPAAGANMLSFFSIPRGQNATLITAGATGAKSKTYRDTNMDSSSVVPTKLFMFNGISMAMVHENEGIVTNPLDRDKIKSGGYLQFRIVDKDILFIPLAFIPEFNPILSAAVASAGGQGATDLIVAGAVAGAGQAPIYKFNVPITLNPFENFAVNLVFDGVVTTAKSVDIILLLHATMRRPT